MLKKGGLTNNLFYEFKDKVIEERYEGPGAIKRTKKLTKVYGLDSTKAVRETLIEILRERMDNHKDKFVSRRLYDEFIGLEVKKNGKIEHSSNTHDDLTFAYLMALYVWYYGKNLKELFGITKSAIKTDIDIDEDVFEGATETVEIYEETIQLQNDILNDNSETKSPVEKYQQAKKSIGILHKDWVESERAKEKAALNEAFKDETFLKAYAYKYNLTKDDVELIRSQNTGKLPDSAFIFNVDDVNGVEEYSPLQGNLSDYFKRN